TEGRPSLVVADLRSAMHRLLAPEELLGRRFMIRRNDVLGLQRFTERLVALGYEPATMVVEPGQFARRGGIVDVYSPSADLPIRVEFFGEQVDSIRLFDPVTQRSESQSGAVTIAAPRQLGPRLARDLASVLSTLDLGGLSPEAADRWAKDREALSRGDVSSSLEPYTSYAAGSSLLDYLGPDGLLIPDEPSLLARSAEALAEEAEVVYEELAARGEMPRGLPRPYLSRPDLADRILARRRLSLVTEEQDGELRAEGLPFLPAALWGGRLAAALRDCEDQVAKGRRVVVTSRQADRISEMLREEDIFVSPQESLSGVPAAGSLTVVRGTVAEGWWLEAPALTVLGDAELFGVAKPRPVARRRAGVPISLLSDLVPGDLVVHVDHGIGRYQGLTKMAVDGVERDYLVLEYAAGDRMFVPTDQADRVTKYRGAGEEEPVLSRLGTAEWTRAKEKVKSSARDIAKDLLEIYSARQLAPGHSYQADTPWQAELETSFPYPETADQLQASAEVKADMESPRPMDRLICGDVGYGKTEVALRAAFKAVMDGMQVAVLVPTTVLAQQHYATFRERLQAFPVRVEVLSRFRSPRQQLQVLEGLREGSVDICIGTHRLLQKDVSFKRLGLLVIDEEHRFGVVHKEKLKRLRREVDVITLSATPIPRTLYMSLAGVRDMSTIATPPEERLPIKTYLGEYGDSTVRQAILRELDRGGQVFFVHNRVQGIEEVARRVANLVPEAKVGVAHGQMPEDRLERTMLDFAEGKYDILVCTTIIESGLDIPNANTILINQAERFGLAQLYQLRGRVGRSANRAYAYLLFGKGRRLTPIAEKRLRTIFEASDLGAGFQIALRDLEIRGAGNLLGAEQHGHIAAVGFDLYSRLLAEAVEEMRGQVPAERQVQPVTVDLPLAAYVPVEYVTDDATRLNIYQRLAAAQTEEEVGRLGLEMRDRFGPPPEEAVNLLFLVQLKCGAGRGGVQAIFADGNYLVVRLDQSARVDRAALVQRLGRKVEFTTSQIRLDRRRMGEGWQSTIQEVVESLASSPAAAR
ncbi:MAG: transcription-repair coupling factor, partial [Dehalococcoidales bacterium]|nr:transcription-repair coupling factor [Dehalococcoidales bacterium]